MARSLLIALLSVVAVAGPATAQGLPLPGTPDLTEPPGSTLDWAEDQTTATTASCTVSVCSDAGDAAAAARCRPYEMTFDQNNWPGFNLEADPDYCVRGFIDEHVDWPPREVQLLLDWANLGDAPADEAPAEDTSAPEPSEDPTAEP